MTHYPSLPEAPASQHLPVVLCWSPALLLVPVPILVETQMWHGLGQVTGCGPSGPSPAAPTLGIALPSVRTWPFMSTSLGGPCWLCFHLKAQFGKICLSVYSNGSDPYLYIA